MTMTGRLSTGLSVCQSDEVPPYSSTAEVPHQVSSDAESVFASNDAVHLLARGHADQFLVAKQARARQRGHDDAGVKRGVEPAVLVAATGALGDPPAQIQRSGWSKNGQQPLQ